ncbi:PilZ domain protein [Anaerohalosphaera lusitana]|uniref:PilZ domain protein n=1 Tax=Anaerohalosphaera lusitana TaxID=1936003 RepID=A0A1U9NQF5_9BACT|nr:PilZ domain-containing protein [Anaerohalosphaera lusitana]AQT70162.1 PilZ domain protein [Anaerohalosphaera lusitana]
MDTVATQNRRMHDRLEMELDVMCQTVGLSGGKLFTGKTVDVSQGGALIELHGQGLHDGQLLSIEMSVPPSENLSEFGGRISNYGRVLRTEDNLSEGFNPGSDMVQRVAIEFCDNSHSGI